MPKRASQSAASTTVAPLLVDMDQIGVMCGVSRSTVETWRASGELPVPIRLPGGRLLRWHRDEIEQMIAGWTADPLRKLRA